jgi:hypothetical protein
MKQLKKNKNKVTTHKNRKMGHLHLRYHGPETRIISKLFKNTNI